MDETTQDWLPQDPIPARIAEILRRSKMDDAQVGELVDLVAGLHARRLPIRLFPKGIPWPDMVEVHTIVQPGDLSTFDDILGSGRVDRLEYFPYGIIDPDVIHARLTLR